MISGSHNPIHRIQPIDPDRQDHREEKKKRVRYQGRDWSESEEEEPPSVQQAMSQATPPAKIVQKNTAKSGIYTDKTLLGKAQALFKELTTLEEKAAQLCFLKTPAVYDTTQQQAIELLIQTWQFGGLYFYEGDPLRQAYLIERYQEISKIPLLMANSFTHGLSLFLDGKPFLEGHSLELGKGVVDNNKRLGVHVQLTQEGLNPAFPMNAVEAKAFTKGIRDAGGIIGREKQLIKEPLNPSQLAKPSQEGFLISSLSNYHVKEIVGFKSATFLNIGDNMEERLLAGFEKYDLFLFQDNIIEGIRALVRLVTSGKIRETLLDRHVMKALMIKSNAYK